MSSNFNMKLYKNFCICNVPPAMSKSKLFSLLPEECEVFEIFVYSKTELLTGVTNLYDIQFGFVNIFGTMADIESWCNKVGKIECKGYTLSAMNFKEFSDKFLSEEGVHIKVKLPDETFPEEPSVRVIPTYPPSDPSSDSDDHYNVYRPNKLLKEKFIHNTTSVNDNLNTISAKKGTIISLKNPENAETKRIKSLELKSNLRVLQQRAVQNALQSNSTNQRVVFSECPSTSGTQDLFGDRNSDNENDDDDDDSAKYNFSPNQPISKIKRMRFNVLDTRFKMDEKFDSDSSDNSNSSEAPNNDNYVNRGFDRFDPSNALHATYLVELEKKLKHPDDKTIELPSLPTISEEKTFHFQSELVRILMKYSDSPKLSFLDMFDDDKQEKDTTSDNNGKAENLKSVTDQPNFDETKVASPEAAPCNSNSNQNEDSESSDSWFYRRNDPRFKNALEFFMDTGEFTGTNWKPRQELKKIVKIKHKKYSDVKVNGKKSKKGKKSYAN